MQGLSFASLRKHIAVSSYSFFYIRLIFYHFGDKTSFSYMYIFFEFNIIISQLIPLFVCVGVGCTGCAFYIARLALRNPDVSWNKKGPQEPWKEYENKQYKVSHINDRKRTLEFITLFIAYKNKYYFLQVVFIFVLLKQVVLKSRHTRY